MWQNNNIGDWFLQFLIIGADVSRSRLYINALRRSRRNHRYDDRANNFNDKIHNFDYDDLAYDEEDSFNIIKKPAKRENIEYRVNKLLELAENENSAGYIDPYDVDLYSTKPKPLHRNAAKQESVKLVASKLSRIRALEERLRHIEEMKRSLSNKIRKLQLLKEQESNTKMRIENEVAAAEREWSFAVDRLKPGSYKPLDSLGDTSHMF